MTKNLTTRRDLSVFKALTVLSLACLCLGSPQRAQAQGWVAVPCDATGTPLTSNEINSFASNELNDQINANGYLPLADVSQKGGTATNSNTYPPDASGDPYDPLGLYYAGGVPYDPNAFPLSNDAAAWSYLTFYSVMSPSSIDQWAIGVLSSGGNSNYYNQPNNGSVTTHVTGDLKGYYTWQPYNANDPGIPMPTTMPLLVRSTLWVSGWIGTGGDALFTYASASASNTLGDTTNGSMWDGNWLGNGNGDAEFHYHLLQVPVSGTNGVATVEMKGTMDTYLNNASPLSLFGPTYMNCLSEMSAAAKYFPAALEGHSTADTANWDPTHPRFFSGTACKINGTAIPISGYVTHAQLCIVEQGQDQVVKEYWDTGETGCPNPLPTDGSVKTGTQQPNGNLPSPTLAALFDSTHFANSAMIVLKLKVWDSNGGYYDGQIQGPAYNKAYVLTNKTLTKPIDLGPISKSLLEMNHSVPSPSDSDNASTIHNNIPNFTVFFMNTDGKPGSFSDCLSTDYLNFGNPSFTSGNVISVADAVTNKTHFQPPYNLAFLFTCESLESTNGAINSAQIGFGISGSDRAVVGFDVIMLQNQHNSDWTATFWGNLARGFTVRESVVLTDYFIGRPDAGLINITSGIFEGGYGRYGHDPIIQGDWATTLHGIYGNQYHASNRYNLEEYDTTANQWHRPLN